MALSYMNLCNKVLRRINEVEFSATDFDSATGLHAATKDAVLHAIAKINSAEFEWPFNATTYTQTLQAGVESYRFPSDLKTVDFNSFQIQRDVNSVVVTKINSTTFTYPLPITNLGTSVNEATSETYTASTGDATVGAINSTSSTATVGARIDISSASLASNVVSVATTSAHGLSTGDTVGITELGFSVTDPNSVRVDNFRTLRKIERDEYFNHGRDADANSLAAGRGMPDHIFLDHGVGSGLSQDLYFGITPSPNKAYKVKFNYFAVPFALTEYDDVCKVPDNFEHVVVDGAVHFMFTFKENMDAGQLALMSFQQGIKEMQTQLINSYERITDRRVAFGGGKIGIQVADRV
jgi:hypothetical protein